MDKITNELVAMKKIISLANLKMRRKIYLQLIHHPFTFQLQLFFTIHQQSGDKSNLDNFVCS